MEILGIGPLELLFIILIALIVLGPNDMVKTGRTIGKFLRNIVTSQVWRNFQQASKDLRKLPNKLMREAGLEEEDLKQLTDLSGRGVLDDVDKELTNWESGISSWTSPPPVINTPKEPVEPSQKEHNEQEQSDSKKQE